MIVVRVVAQHVSDGDDQLRWSPQQSREEVICEDAAGAAHHLVQGLCRTCPGQQPTLREGVARASNKRASPFGLAPGTCAASPSEAQRELELRTTLHLNRDISQVAHFRYRSIRPRVF